jgi:uncharacterized protein YeaO (DUF488 family)
VSFAAVAWAGKQTLPRPANKLVLWALADAADRHTALCYPSIPAICAFSGLNRKTVMASLVALAGMGLIEDTGARRGDTRQIRVWRLPIGRGPDSDLLSTGESSPKAAPFPGRERVPKQEQSQNRNSPVFGGKESQKRDTEPVREPTPSEASPPTEKRARKGRPPRDWHPLPAEFQPVLTPGVRALVDRWPPGMLDREIDQWRDKVAATGKLAKDWQADLRTWLRNADTWRKDRMGGGNGRSGQPAGQYRDPLFDPQLFGRGRASGAPGAAGPDDAGSGGPVIDGDFTVRGRP